MGMIMPRCKLIGVAWQTTGPLIRRAWLARTIACRAESAHWVTTRFIERVKHFSVQASQRTAHASQRAVTSSRFTGNVKHFSVQAPQRTVQTPQPTAQASQRTVHAPPRTVHAIRSVSVPFRSGHAGFRRMMCLAFNAMRKQPWRPARQNY